MGMQFEWKLACHTEVSPVWKGLQIYYNHNSILNKSNIHQSIHINYTIYSVFAHTKCTGVFRGFFFLVCFYDIHQNTNAWKNSNDTEIEGMGALELAAGEQN